MIGQRIGNYEIEATIGAGGMGVVYRARDLKLRRPVAIKFLGPGIARDELAHARFLREGQAASALDHPNIGTVYEIGEHEGRPFIAMAFYEGEDLRSRIARGPVSLEQAEAIVTQLLEGIGAAHRAGIIHRDLKPANLLLTPEGVLKIVDFGLAKLSSPDNEETALTGGGTTLGTIAYMSPEQARAEDIDARSDLWSAGVIAYELLAGAHPFDATSRVGILSRIVSGEPVPIESRRSDVPPRFRALVKQLLQKDRARRPASAAEARKILAGKPPVRDRPRWTHRHSFASVTLVLVAAVVLAARFLPRAIQPATTPARAGASRSVVVLPCQVFGNAEAAFLTDAIPSTLSTFLGGLSGLETRKPPTSFEADPKRQDLAALARSYEVTDCITCSVTAESDELTLHIQLVDPRTRSIIWTRALQGDRAGYMSLIRAGADGLREVLAPASTLAAVERTGVVAGAEIEYRRGMHYLLRFNNLRAQDDFDAALAAFTHVLELDPEHANSAAQIALLHQFYLGKDPSPERVRTSIDWARRALAMDERCGRAWTVLAMTAGLGNSFTPQERLEFALKAVRYDPTDELAHFLLSFALPSARMALESMRRSTEIDPLYAWGWLGRGLIESKLDRFDDAVRSMDRAVELEHGMLAVHILKPLVQASAGQFREAAASLDGAQSFRGADYESRYRLAHALVDLERAGSGARGEPLQRLSEAIASCTSTDCMDDCVLALQALARVAALEPAFALVSRFGVALNGVSPIYDTLLLSPLLKPLREDARFSEAMIAWRRGWKESRAVLEQARDRGHLPEWLRAPLAEQTATIAEAVARTFPAGSAR